MLSNLKSYNELNEAERGGSRPDQFKDIMVEQPYSLGKNLFATGKSEINKNSPEYKTALAAIKRIPTGNTLLVSGRASLVGVGKGNWTEEKNKELAKKRAENFVKALKDDGVTSINYKIDYAQSTDTRSAKAGSEEARNEQSVVLIRYEKTPSQKQIIAQDNTWVAKPLMPVSGGKKEYFVLLFEYDAEESKRNPSYSNELIKKLARVAKDDRATTKNITKWYSENR
jgi:hypothetical protein